MARYSGTFWKNCATCDFWTGSREAEASTHTVQIDPAARGSCTLKTKYPVRYATNVCSAWKEWQVLGIMPTG